MTLVESRNYQEKSKSKNHRELVLEGKCDIASGQKIKQYIYQLAECIQLKPVQATEIHLVDCINVHFKIK